MTRRADIMAAVKTICENAVSANAVGVWSLVPKVEVKPGGAPIDIPPEGLIVLRDRGLKSDTVEFGRGADKTGKEITLTVGIEAYVADQAEITAADALNGLMAAVGDAVESDPTLGALVDDSDIGEGDDENFADLGTDTIAGQLVTLTATWNSERTLG